MKFLWNDKDGGPDSKVWCWGLEIKGLFSVLLLKFGEGSREAFHSHAFNSVSWVLDGRLRERKKLGAEWELWLMHNRSFKPIFTYRDTFHKVIGMAKVTWVLTFRGPWDDTWKESTPARGEYTLTHGRQEVA